MNKMNLNDWMRMEFLPGDFAAAKYTVGQNLTEEQAKEITRIIARSVDFKLDVPSVRKNLSIIGTPYRDFITCMTHLMLVGKANPKWETALWNALDSQLQKACHTVILSHIMHF